MVLELLPHKPSVYGMLPEELAFELGGTGRAHNVWRLLRQGIDPFGPGSLPEGAATRLKTACSDLPMHVLARSTAQCKTTKLLLQLNDELRVETVLIPTTNRTTVCISSQVGCARGCRFCVTATMNLVRNLSAAEIVGQLRIAQTEIQQQGLAPLRNVVFMGMGEPLDNLKAVRQALSIITDHQGLGVAPRHVCVSTVGTNPASIWELRDLPCTFAWSLHIANETQRRHLIPTMKHSLEELRAAFIKLIHHRRCDLFVEVTLIKDLNDSTADAQELANFLEPLRPHARVNLLPLNGGREGMQPSDERHTLAYQKVIREHNVLCFVRTPRGREQNAACGQLAVS